MGHKLGNPRDFPGLSVWPDATAPGYYTFERSLSEMIPWETYWSAGLWIEVNQVPSVFDYFLSTGPLAGNDSINVYISPSSGKAVLSVWAGGAGTSGTVDLKGKGPLLVTVHRHAGTTGFNLRTRVFDLDGNELESLGRQSGGLGSDYDVEPFIEIGRRGDGDTDRYFENGKLGHFYLITHQDNYGEDGAAAEAADFDIAMDAVRGVDLIDKYGERCACYLPLSGTLQDLTGNGHNAVANHVGTSSIYMDSSTWIPPMATEDDYLELVIASLQGGGGVDVNVGTAALNITTYPVDVSIAGTEVNVGVVSLVLTTYPVTVFLGGARAFDATPPRSFDEDYGYFDGPDPIVLYEVTSVASAEAFGSPEFQLTLEDPNSIASAESVSAPTQFYHILFASSIASAEAFEDDGSLSLDWTEGGGLDSTWSTGSAGSSVWSETGSVDSTWETS